MTRDYDTVAREYVQACLKGNIGLRARLEQELDEQTRQQTERLSRPDALLTAAVWYARRGVAVFPCEPRGKRPLTEHGLKDATTDVDKVAAWWRARPAANIGAPTGHAFDVVDIDGPEGVAAVYQPGRELPPEIGHALTSRPGGHHLFIEPTGRGNAASFLPSVDYRGAGGYVILPPSIGANGRRYTWTRPLSLQRAAA